MPTPFTVWGLRILCAAGIVLVCVLVKSGTPALAFSIVWGPNGLFLAAYLRGALQLPRFLEPVKPIEPVLYRWAGVGLVNRVVETPHWPMLNGFDPPPTLRNRREFLDRTELTAKGAEICHAWTFVVALLVALFCLAIGRQSLAFWILGLNLLFNGYPFMLQRTHRWRIQKVRANA